MGKKLIYASPQIEVLRMETEDILAASLPRPADGGSAYGRNSSPPSYNGASSSELEDLINDILTVEQ